MKTFFLSAHLNSGKIIPIKRPWLNWIECLATDQKVAGLNPAGRQAGCPAHVFILGGEHEGLDCILFKKRNHKEDG